MNVEVVGTAISGGLLVLGYTAKQIWDSTRANRAAKDVANSNGTPVPVVNAVTATEVLRGTLESVDAQYRHALERLDRLEAKYEQERRERDKERMIRESQSKRLDEHDREIGHIKRQFSLAVTYIRSLLAFITDKGLADDAPKPPSGLHLD